eukprot:CAMPEP_0206151422 /NCGR_PEP_ID=MMETSP1473-20131121/38816_1 /ASSEMBLY_ACC=CAM_ASM_001109 /TAXON_ID=1461547 /ORGANISM="Stichococcus sp, Strain RCC1054" /LENGTH=163 /DNA_ID=CAMNT_0053548969 /DNA_START=37 /DNA_END=529 /DNA_ORIENTATION=-
MTQMHPAALAAPPKARKAEGLAPLPLPLSFHWQWLIPLLKHPPQPHVLSTAIGGGIAVDEGVEAVWIQRRTRSFCRVPLAVRSKRYPGEVGRPDGIGFTSNRLGAAPSPVGGGSSSGRQPLTVHTSGADGEAAAVRSQVFDVPGLYRCCVVSDGMVQAGGCDD